jgi:hypothetical protein
MTVLRFAQGVSFLMNEHFASNRNGKNGGFAIAS